MPKRWPYEALGDPKAPPLIFLHGFLGSHLDWLPVARVFASAYHCILPDLPGHGENTHIDTHAPLTFAQLSADLLQLIDELNLISPVLIGYSLGGRTALNFAASHSAKLRGLVLESTSPGIAQPRERAQRAALDDTRAGSIRADLASFLENWYNAGLWASLKHQPDTLADLLRRRSKGNPADLAKVISDLSPGRMPSLWEALPHIALPTLLMAGTLDIKYTEIILRSAALMPDGQPSIIEQAGHNIHLEKPEAFIGELKRFLTEIIPHTG